MAQTASAMTNSLAGKPDVLPFDVALKPVELSSVDSPALSPDGKTIAYSLYQQTGVPEGLREPAAYYKGTRLFIKDLASGQVHPLGQGHDAAYAPSWSPDGQQLAYYVLRDEELSLFIYDLKTGRERRLLGQVADDPLVNGSAAWSPNGQQIALPLKPEAQVAAATTPVDATHQETGAQVERYSTTAEPQTVSITDIKLPDSELVLVQVKSGKVKRITQASDDPNAVLPYFSPSGKWLLLPLHLRFDMETGGSLFDLVALRLADQQRFVVQSALPMGQAIFSDVSWGWHPKRDQVFFFRRGKLFRTDLTGTAPTPPQALASGNQPLLGNTYAFSPDGATLYTPVLSDPAGQKIQQLAVIPLSGAPSTQIKLPSHLSLSSFLRIDRLTAWQPQAGSLALAVHNLNTKQSQIVQYNAALGIQKTLLSRAGLFTAGQVRWNSVISHSSSLLTTFQDFNTPPMIARLDSAGPLKPTVLADDRAANYPLGRAEFIQTPYTDDQGKDHLLNTAVLLPPNWKKGQSTPAIAHQYGGANLAALGLTYGGGHIGTLPAAIFTSRGYVVLQLDVPLAPEGTAQNTRTALKGPVLAQLKHAAELGLIDPKRVAVIGQSYGGFGVASLLSDSGAFRAGVAIAGLYDLSNQYGFLDGSGSYWAESGQGRLGATPWEKPSLYLENSPFYQANKIHTPLMLIHGLQDQTAQSLDAQKMFVALKRLNGNAELLLYPHGGHVITEWPYEDAADVSQRILDFLNSHLK